MNGTKNIIEAKEKLLKGGIKPLIFLLSYTYNLGVPFLNVTVSKKKKINKINTLDKVT